MNSKVSISFQEDIKNGINEALDNLEDISSLFTTKHVAIKPNDTWASYHDVVQAARLGLGKSSMDNINIVGIPLDEAIQIFKRHSADKHLDVLPARS
jgi:hypothetical protein